MPANRTHGVLLQVPATCRLIRSRLLAIRFLIPAKQLSLVRNQVKLKVDGVVEVVIAPSQYTSIARYFPDTSIHFHPNRRVRPSDQ